MQRDINMMLLTIGALLIDESGATMIEYGLLLALVALVALEATARFGASVSALFSGATAIFGSHTAT